MIWLRPTRVGQLFITATAAAAAVAFMNVALITALVASALGAFLLCSLLLSLFAASGFRVERHLAGEGCCGEEMVLPLTVRNVLPWFRQDCVILEELPFCTEKTVAFEVPCLAPREVMTLDRKVCAVKRGHYHLQKLYLCGGDPAGLFSVRKRFSLPGEVLIVPKCVMPSSYEVENLNGSSFRYEGRLTARPGLGNDFFGVRPYRAGDEMRHIHWRLSASKQKLMVREFEALAIDHVTLVLDSDSSRIGMDEMENNFEKLLSLALSLSAYFAEHSCHLSLLLRYNDHGVTRITGEASFIFSRIREILTELHGSPGTLEDWISENLELFPEGEEVCILSMGNGKSLHQCVTLLEEHNCHVVIFYAPKECFPYIPEDEPVQFVQEKVEKYPDSALRCLITCQTSFDELKIAHHEEF